MNNPPGSSNAGKEGVDEIAQNAVKKKKITKGRKSKFNKEPGEEVTYFVNVNDIDVIQVMYLFGENEVETYNNVYKSMDIWLKNNRFICSFFTLKYEEKRIKKWVNLHTKHIVRSDEVLSAHVVFDEQQPANKYNIKKATSTTANPVNSVETSNYSQRNEQNLSVEVDLNLDRRESALPSPPVQSDRISAENHNVEFTSHTEADGGYIKTSESTAFNSKSAAINKQSTFNKNRSTSAERIYGSPASSYGECTPTKHSSLAVSTPKGKRRKKSCVGDRVIGRKYKPKVSPVFKRDISKVAVPVISQDILDDMRAKGDFFSDKECRSTLLSLILQVYKLNLKGHQSNNVDHRTFIKSVLKKYPIFEDSYGDQAYHELSHLVSNRRSGRKYDKVKRAKRDFNYSKVGSILLPDVPIRSDCVSCVALKETIVRFNTQLLQQQVCQKSSEDSLTFADTILSGCTSLPAESNLNSSTFTAVNSGSNSSFVSCPKDVCTTDVSVTTDMNTSGDTISTISDRSLNRSDTITAPSESFGSASEERFQPIPMVHNTPYMNNFAASSYYETSSYTPPMTHAYHSPTTYDYTREMELVNSFFPFPNTHYQTTLYHPSTEGLYVRGVQMDTQVDVNTCNPVAVDDRDLMGRSNDTESVPTTVLLSASSDSGIDSPKSNNLTQLSNVNSSTSSTISALEVINKKFVSTTAKEIRGTINELQQLISSDSTSSSNNTGTPSIGLQNEPVPAADKSVEKRQFLPCGATTTTTTTTTTKTTTITSPVRALTGETSTYNYNDPRIDESSENDPPAAKKLKKNYGVLPGRLKLNKQRIDAVFGKKIEVVNTNKCSPVTDDNDDDGGGGGKACSKGGKLSACSPMLAIGPDKKKVEQKKIALKETKAASRKSLYESFTNGTITAAKKKGRKGKSGNSTGTASTSSRSSISVNSTSAKRKTQDDDGRVRDNRSYDATPWEHFISLTTTNEQMTLLSEYNDLSKLTENLPELMCYHMIDVYFYKFFPQTLNDNSSMAIHSNIIEKFLMVHTQVARDEMMGTVMELLVYLDYAAKLEFQCMDVGSADIMTKDRTHVLTITNERDRKLDRTCILNYPVFQVYHNDQYIITSAIVFVGKSSIAVPASALTPYKILLLILKTYHVLRVKYERSFEVFTTFLELTIGTMAADKVDTKPNAAFVKFVNSTHNTTNTRYTSLNKAELGNKNVDCLEEIRAEQKRLKELKASLET